MLFYFFFFFFKQKTAYEIVDCDWSSDVCSSDLCGDFSIADVMYAPVALRFVTYGIELKPEAQRFVTAVTALASIQQWTQAAIKEEETLPFIDAHARR